MIRSKKEDKNFLLFIGFFYLFLTKDCLERQLPYIGYTDELIAALAIPLAFLQLHGNNFIVSLKKRSGSWFWILLFLIFGLAGNFLYQYQPFLGSVLPDAFLGVKFWLALYVGMRFFRNFDLQKNAERIFFHVKLVSWLYVSLILADSFFHIFTPFMRYGLRSTHLFYSHPSVFASMCIFLIAITFSIRGTIPGCDPYMFLNSFLMVTTLRSKALAAAMTVVLIYYFIVLRKKKIRARTMILFLPLTIALGWEQFAYYFLSTIHLGSARYQLMVNSIRIANDHFPLGAGFGSFASYFSSICYSPLYAKYGLNHIQGLEKDAAAFVTDSFWPTLIAQTGWFGTAAFVMALIMLFRRIQSMYRVNVNYYMAALSIFIYELIDTTAETAFFHNLAIPLAIWTGCLFGQMQRYEKKINAE